MNKLTLISRIVFGLLFFVFGLNGFLNFIPMPANIPEKMVAFSSGLMASGYFFPLLKGTELVCGLLLLSGYFVPLALVVLAPIILNIILVHAFLEPSGLPMAVVLAAFEIYLSFFAKPYSNVVKQLFRCSGC